MDEGGKPRGRGLKIIEKIKTRSPGLGITSCDDETPKKVHHEKLAGELSTSTFVVAGKSSSHVACGRGTKIISQMKFEHISTVQRESIPEEYKEKKTGLGRGNFLAQLAKQAKLRSENVADDEAVLQYTKGPFTSASSSSLAGSCSKSSFFTINSKMDQLDLESEPCVNKGEAGEKIDVFTNYVTLTIDPGKGIFEYHVQFTPEIDFAAFRYKLINQFFQSGRGIKCYDGRDKLYLPEKLLDDQQVIKAMHPNDESAVNIIISFKRQMRPKECSLLYNILFHNCTKILNLARLGRQFYDYRLGHQIPQHKLEIWPGYVTSVEEFEGGIHLCCDIKHRVLRTESAYDILANIAKYDSSNFRNLAAKELLGQCVLTRYNNNLYRIDDIDWDKTPETTFTLSSGEEISFIDYYKKQYKLDIMDFKQPLLVNRPKRKENEKNQLICLVPELCHMTGLTDKMRKDMKVMKEIAMYTRVTPVQRHLGLKKFLENIRNNSQAQKLLKDWGLNIAEDPVEMDGRILPTENIIFKNNQRISSPGNSEWSKYLRNFGALRSVDIKNWILVYTNRDSKLANNFRCMLQSVGPGLGIEVNDPVKVALKDDRIDSYIRGLKENINSATQIIVCLCPTPRDDRYSAIKKLCCREIPVPSQIINCGTISREHRMRAVVQNVALQINNKLGGASWAVHVPLKNCMVCGIDSYHDSDKRGNSVGAFVASLDDEYTQWFSRTCIQEPKQELLDGLVHCFISALKKYLFINKTLPDRIVIFRDGVSDGQLPVVQKHEIQQFLDGCLLMSKGYSPRFSFIVVQKRINTKFYHKLNASGNKVENPSSGSVVDHHITRRNYYDFFLVSQHVSCGTATPSHYIVLYDSSELKPDHMQRLTYKFCHMYYNWPGTIRVPAPCQYAHKLAYLVGQNIKGLPSSHLEDKLYYL